MGHIIEQIAISKGHEIILKIDSASKELLNETNIRQADVAIEFTKPEAAMENVMLCIKAGVPVVSGTTGWNEGVTTVKKIAEDHKSAFLHASNFSIGVNIFFELNKQLAKMMDDQEDYDLILEEIHHTEKKDAPSGTAITLAEQIIERLRRKSRWSKEAKNEEDSFPIISHRTENVPGTHSVKYSSPIDDIEIIHTAHNREGFAKGAVLAAEYICGKSGVFTMQDVLGISTTS